MTSQLLFFIYSREQREREQREREQREKEQREKEQREKEREREERERHFAAAQMYAAEMQRNLFLSGFHAASQRSPLGLGLGFPPGVPSLPPHMAGHPFSHISAMAGIPSLSHTSPIPTSYNASSSSLNLSQSRNHVSSSPIGGGENAAAPAHSSNIPALPKHYFPPHKTDSSSKQKHPPVSMPLTSIASAHDTSMYVSSERRHANSSNNRNSSNHHNSTNSNLNAEQHHSKGIPKSMYEMQRDHRIPPRMSAASYTGADASVSVSSTPVECKYSISLERINSNLVTNNDSRNEPMELSASSDAIQKQQQLQQQLQQHQHQQQQQQQAKFNPEQISPKKRQLIGSDSNIKMIHQNDELKNGCQERSNEAKDLSGRYSLYDAVSHYQPATSTSATIDLRSSSSDERSASDSIRHQMPYGNSADRQRSIVHSPEIFSKEPIVSSVEHDSTISKDNTNILSKNIVIGDVEQENAIVTTASIVVAAAAAATTTASIEVSSPITAVVATTTTTTTAAATDAISETNKQRTANESNNWMDTDAAKSTTPTKSPSKNNTDETTDSREKSPPNNPTDTPKSSDTLDASARDSDPCRKISTDNADKDNSDGTAVSVEAVEMVKQTKS